MRKVNYNESKKDVNWSIKQWVIAKSGFYKNQIVLITDTDITTDLFSGVVLPCEKFPFGEYRTDWCKSAFKSLDFNIPFVISNED